VSCNNNCTDKVGQRTRGSVEECNSVGWKMQFSWLKKAIQLV